MKSGLASPGPHECACLLVLTNKGVWWHRTNYCMAHVSLLCGVRLCLYQRPFGQRQRRTLHAENKRCAQRIKPAKVTATEAAKVGPTVSPSTRPRTAWSATAKPRLTMALATPPSTPLPAAGTCGRCARTSKTSTGQHLQAAGSTTTQSSAGTHRTTSTLDARMSFRSTARGEWTMAGKVHTRGLLFLSLK